jgi:hypothetical protein
LPSNKGFRDLKTAKKPVAAYTIERCYIENMNNLYHLLLTGFWRCLGRTSPADVEIASAEAPYYTLDYEINMSDPF